MGMRRVIIFEGISGSGKSTIEDLYRARNNYYDYTIHRFTASKYVYSATENRSIDVRGLWRIEEGLQNICPVWLVTLTCNPYEAIRRKEDMGDPSIEENIAKAQELFITYHNEITRIKRRILLSTDVGTSQTMNKLMGFLGGT